MRQAVAQLPDEGFTIVTTAIAAVVETVTAFASLSLGSVLALLELAGFNWMKIASFDTDAHYSVP